MTFRADSTKETRLGSSTRERVCRCCLSRTIPRLCTRVLGIRHLGQGHAPKLRILARRILEKIYIRLRKVSGGRGALFGIVSRICEKPGIKAPLNPVAAGNHDTMLVSLPELIIKQNFPLCVDEFAVTVSQKNTCRSSSTCMLRCKILELIWKLKTRNE
jgi:hypothetical protein